MRPYSDHHPRRTSIRIPLRFGLTHYIRDDPAPGTCVNLGTRGLYVRQALRRARQPWSPTLGLEFELPGTNEVIWARGEVVFDHITPAGHGMGLRFSGMAGCHRGLVRDYLVDWRRQMYRNMLALLTLEKQRAAESPPYLPAWLDDCDGLL